MPEITNPRRFIMFILVVGIVIVAVIITFIWGPNTLQQSGQLEIEQGNSAKVIWQQLVDQGYSQSTIPWQYYGWRLNAAPKIQAGVYQLEQNEHVRTVVQRFISGDVSPDELTITYPEGFTVEQMATRTTDRGLGTKEEFLTAADGQEGYLFPDTYRFAEDTSAREVVEKMRANFDRRLEQADLEIDRDTLIMASIVEREVQTDEDMALVAGVLWSRYNDNAGLGADATVRYALNKWDGPLTVQDLAIDSPYNTRRYAGLPPGPISNPGLRALQAAANPEESEYYYYLSAPSGETIFSRTLDEHNRNKAQYLR